MSSCADTPYFTMPKTRLPFFAFGAGGGDGRDCCEDEKPPPKFVTIEPRSGRFGGRGGDDATDTAGDEERLAWAGPAQVAASARSVAATSLCHTQPKTEPQLTSMKWSHSGPCRSATLPDGTSPARAEPVAGSWKT